VVEQQAQRRCASPLESPSTRTPHASSSGTVTDLTYRVTPTPQCHQPPPRPHTHPAQPSCILPSPTHLPLYPTLPHPPLR
jgi:hypothetical protein